MIETAPDALSWRYLQKVYGFKDPTLVFEGLDCSGKTTLRAAYTADRRARLRADLPSIDRLNASCAVYPALRDLHRLDSYYLAEGSRRVDWNNYFERDAHLSRAGFVYVFVDAPLADVTRRMLDTNHPFPPWTRERERAEFLLYFKSTPMPVLRLDTAGLSPEDCVRLLKLEFENE